MTPPEMKTRVAQGPMSDERLGRTARATLYAVGAHLDIEDMNPDRGKGRAQVVIRAVEDGFEHDWRVQVSPGVYECVRVSVRKIPFT